jgi:hypothetical protein
MSLHVADLLAIAGLILLEMMLWHVLLGGGPGPSSDPPDDGGPRRRPGPPSPSLHGDRSPRRSRLTRSPHPSWPTPAH